MLAVSQNICPDNIAVALYHSVCAAELMGLVRKQGGVNSTENHEGPLLASQSADFIAAQCVAGVNADTNDVAGRNACDVQLLQGFVNN